uniref:WW domain-containing protein n=1 Tax=Rhabditophanes sp. KR3021 TaxID=114890 RepID=A0AC35U0C8_9BILA
MGADKEIKVSTESSKTNKGTEQTKSVKQLELRKSGDWIEILSKKNKIYYYNKSANYSLWEKPPGFDEDAVKLSHSSLYAHKSSKIDCAATPTHSRSGKEISCGSISSSICESTMDQISDQSSANLFFDSPNGASSEDNYRVYNKRTLDIDTTNEESLETNIKRYKKDTSSPECVSSSEDSPSRRQRRFLPSNSNNQNGSFDRRRSSAEFKKSGEYEDSGGHNNSVNSIECGNSAKLSIYTEQKQALAHKNSFESRNSPDHNNSIECDTSYPRKSSFDGQSCYEERSLNRKRNLSDRRDSIEPDDSFDHKTSVERENSFDCRNSLDHNNSANSRQLHLDKKSYEQRFADDNSYSDNRRNSEDDNRHLEDHRNSDDNKSSHVHKSSYEHRNSYDKRHSDDNRNSDDNLDDERNPYKQRNSSYDHRNSQDDRSSYDRNRRSASEETIYNSDLNGSCSNSGSGSSGDKRSSEEENNLREYDQRGDTYEKELPTNKINYIKSHRHILRHRDDFYQHNDHSFDSKNCYRNGYNSSLNGDKFANENRYYRSASHEYNNNTRTRTTRGSSSSGSIVSCEYVSPNPVPERKPQVYIEKGLVKNMKLLNGTIKELTNIFDKPRTIGMEHKDYTAFNKLQIMEILNNSGCKHHSRRDKLLRDVTLSKGILERDVATFHPETDDVDENLERVIEDSDDINTGNITSFMHQKIQQNITNFEKEIYEKITVLPGQHFRLFRSKQRQIIDKYDPPRMNTHEMDFDLKDVEIPETYEEYTKVMNNLLYPLEVTDIYTSAKEMEILHRKTDDILLDQYHKDIWSTPAFSSVLSTSNDSQNSSPPNGQSSAPNDASHLSHRSRYFNLTPPNCFSHSSNEEDNCDSTFTAIKKYMEVLVNERKQFNQLSHSLPNVDRLLNDEIAKIKSSLLSYDVKNVGKLILPEPVGEVLSFSKKFYISGDAEYNFIGRIIGPRGMTVKYLEHRAGTKILIRGKGSMRDEGKLHGVKGQKRYDHLNESLHTIIQCEDTENRAELRIAFCCREIYSLINCSTIQAYEFKQKQLMELAFINGTYRSSYNTIPLAFNKDSHSSSESSVQSSLARNRIYFSENHQNAKKSYEIKDEEINKVLEQMFCI